MIGDSSASTAIFYLRSCLIVSIIQLGMIVFRMLTIYCLFGKVSPVILGKYCEITDHSCLFLQLSQMRFVENSFQLGKCCTQRTSDFFSSFFLPLRMSLPKEVVKYLGGGVYFYMWLSNKSSIVALFGHFSANLVGAIL